MSQRDTFVVRDDPEDESERTDRVTPLASRIVANAHTAVFPRDFGLKLQNVMPTLDATKFVPTINPRFLSSVASAAWLKTQQDSAAAALSKLVSPTNFMPKTDFSEVWGTAGVESVLASLKELDSLRAFEATTSFAVPAFKGFDRISADIVSRTIAQMLDANKLLEPLLEHIRSLDWDEIRRRRALPDNWSKTAEERLEVLIEMVSVEGIPAAWVPRADVLEELLDVSPGDERSAILIARRESILEDCAAWIDDLEDDFLAPFLPVAREVLAACQNGHWRVAAIAAVTVTHNVVEALHWVSDRQRVAKYHRVTTSTPRAELMEQATRAPLVRFYDDWNPNSPQPRPTHVTRHVVSHHLDADQVTERNCVVAVMLMSSLLITVYQRELGPNEQRVA